jgi:hypothetical protein
MKRCYSYCHKLDSQLGVVILWSLNKLCVKHLASPRQVHETT